MIVWFGIRWIWEGPFCKARYTSACSVGCIAKLPLHWNRSIGSSPNLSIWDSPSQTALGPVRIRAILKLYNLVTTWNAREHAAYGVSQRVTPRIIRLLHNVNMSSVLKLSFNFSLACFGFLAIVLNNTGTGRYSSGRHRTGRGTLNRTTEQNA